MKSTQKDIIHYGLGRYIASDARDISADEGFPTASVRRVLGELVAEGRAKFKNKDIFGNPGYVRAGR